MVERGLIPREIAEATRRVRDEPGLAEMVQPAFEAAYEGRYEAFRGALVDARDYMGTLRWPRRGSVSRPTIFPIWTSALILIEVDRDDERRPLRRAIVESFDWREIGRATVGPRLKPPGPRSHTHSARTITPEHRPKPAENELPRTGDRGWYCLIVRQELIHRRSK